MPQTRETYQLVDKIFINGMENNIKLINQNLFLAHVKTEQLPAVIVSISTVHCSRCVHRDFLVPVVLIGKFDCPPTSGKWTPLDVWVTVHKRLQKQYEKI